MAKDLFPTEEDRDDVVEHTGRGDPLKTIALLWHGDNRTGRSGISLDAILDAGIELANETGIDNLSMRKLAERLGVGTMSLYSFVPSKAELIDLMVDRVNGEAYQGAEGIAEQATWRQSIEAVAEQNWRLLARHRWLLAVDEARPVLGPGTIAKYDTELRQLDGLGLNDVEMDLTLTLVLQHVRSAARLAADLTDTSQVTGDSEGEWWSKAGPVLAALIDSSKYPHASRIGAAAGQEYNAATDPQRAYHFGLRTILDGVEKLIQDRSRSNEPPAAG